MSNIHLNEQKMFPLFYHYEYTPFFIDTSQMDLREKTVLALSNRVRLKM